MSFGTASVDVELDASRAEVELRQLLQRIAQANAVVVVQVDATNVAPEIEGAVDAADSNVIVTGDATEVTGDIDGAVDAADSAVVITGDATEVTGDIDGAVDAADTAVVVTGEAAEVTGAIDGAVEAADSAVVVTADASEVTGSITAAVDAADTRVDIDAGGGAGIDALSNAVGGLNTNLIASSQSGLQLRSTMQALSVGAIAIGLFQAAQAASDLAESQSKANVVFGDAINVVGEFASTSTTSIGLSEQAALEAAGTFGNLFTALGLTQSAAASLAPDVLQLGADLASFNNLGVEDTLERIRSGLVGEIEPLRSIGISFNAADVEARAFELGLAGANGELSEGAKVQARWSLIVEQSSNAAGDFARTSDGLANQQRILAAEFQNAVTQAGQHLLPTLLDLVGVGREQLIPAFSQMAEQVLPPLASAFTSLLPAVGGFSNIIVGLAPVLELLATLLGAIPPDILVLGATFFAATRVVGGLSSGLSALQTRLLSSRLGATSLGQSLGGIGGGGGAGGGALLAAAGLTVLTFALQQNAEAAARNEQRIQTLASSMSQGETPAEGLAEGLRQLSAEGDSVVATLSGTGVTIDKLAAAVAAGVDPWVLLGSAAEAAAESGDLAGIGMARLAENIRDSAEQNVLAAQRSDENTAAMANAAIAASTYGHSYGDLTIAEVDYVQAAALLAESIEREEEANNAAAEAAIRHGLAIGQFTQTQADAALASEDVAAALEELELQTADYVSTAQLAEDALVSVVDVSGATADATRAYAAALSGLSNEQLPVNEGLAAFALAASSGAITEEQLGQAAQALGVNLADLQGFVEAVSSEINTFADTAIATIPTVSSIIGDLGEDFSAQGLLDELREVTGAIVEFEANIAALAAFPNVQRVAAENGPLVAAALAEPIAQGNTQVLAELEAQLGLYDDVYGELDRKLREEIGPQIITDTGAVAEESATAFGEKFDPQAKAEKALIATNAAVEVFTTIFGGSLNVFGETGAKAFEGAIAGIPGDAGRTANSASGKVREAAPGAASAGKTLGGAIKGGVGVGIDGTPGVVAAAAKAAANAAAGLAGTGAASGKVLGGAIMGGVASGVASGQSSVIASIKSAVNNAIGAAKEALGISSPSRVFAEMGEDMGAGLVVGLESSQRSVVDAATGVAAAAAGLLGAPGSVEVSAAALSPTEVFGAGMLINTLNMTFNGDVTPDTGREMGEAFVDGANETLRRRQLVHSVRTG